MTICDDAATRDVATCDVATCDVATLDVIASASGAAPEGGAGSGPDRSSGPVSGEWLAAERVRLDRGEARWLRDLARFDLERGWAADGQVSCAAWLMWRAGMSRGAAFEKLRVAHELRRRPAVAAAFGAGRLSYSAVRAITRVSRPDPEVDVALVDLAAGAPVRDVERAVRHYQLCADQDRPLGAAWWEQRQVRVRCHGDGTGSVAAVLDEAEAAEVDAVIGAFMAAAGSDGPEEATPPAGSAVDQSSREDTVGGDSPWEDCPPERVVAWRRRADAFMAMVRTAMAHLGGRYAAGADRYMVHLVMNGPGGESELLDGTPLRASAAARLCCDASVVTHHRNPEGEPLRLGRRTRIWSIAQRRAVMVRDGGTCRYPGCANRICDIHHLRPWEKGGPTDVENGVLLCTRHHTFVHEGFRAVGDANQAVTFYRADGTPVGVTPSSRRRLG